MKTTSKTGYLSMQKRREISLDTETTGLKAEDGDRLVEIGAVEMIDMIPTGKTYHVYINPERDMPQGAFEVHGLSEAFLSDKPVFKEVAQEFLDFIGDSRLIIHNAAFDMGFLNMELRRAKMPEIPKEQAFDTVRLAQEKLPGRSAKLDNLCKIMKIDNSHRTLHGALIDADLLARVYLQLQGGPNYSLNLDGDEVEEEKVVEVVKASNGEIDYSLVLKPTETELRDNKSFREEHSLTGS